MNDYYDLGNFSRPITTDSAEAQLWFNRGLTWLYGFNHEEAIRCFERASEADPKCAMAYWGIAYANGPYINKEWRFYSDGELAEMLPLMAEVVEKAERLAVDGTAVEQALIHALNTRYQAEEKRPLPEMDQWLDDFAFAMSNVYTQFPDDRDVMALYVEAMMMRTPWQLWDLQTGEVAEGASTVEMTAVLDRAFQLTAEQNLDPHPGLIHMLIHTLEMSPFPERALPAANQIRDLIPDSGHLQHMPSHIDVLCGHYANAVAASEKAIAADQKYLAQVGVFGQYTTACCHDCHLMMLAAMMLGQYQPAIKAVQHIHNLVTKEVLQAATPAFTITLENYYSMAIHVLIRFGKWQEIVDVPLPDDPELYCATTAMHHYAKAIAHATLGQFEAAEQSRTSFEATMATIPEDRHLFNNTTHTVLAIARAMMNGEVAYHQEQYETAFNHLRQAVTLNDELNYTEPWAWMHPPRHALGALLLAQGHVEEAKSVYEADLGLTQEISRATQHPNNVWSLHGYVECLERLGQAEKVTSWQKQLDTALALTDVPIHASCACRIDSCCHS